MHFIERKKFQNKFLSYNKFKLILSLLNYFNMLLQRGGALFKKLNINFNNIPSMLSNEEEEICQIVAIML